MNANGWQYFSRVPAVFSQEYIMSILEGETELPDALTPYGERVLITEAYSVVNSLLDQVPAVFAEVVNFLQWLDNLHPTNADVATKMQLALYKHPNFIMYYMPLIRQQIMATSSGQGSVFMFVKMAHGPDAQEGTSSMDDNYTDKISDDYMHDILKRLSPIPDMQKEHFVAFLEAFSDKVVTHLVGHPPFYKVVQNFICKAEGDEERALAEKIVQKMSSPDFLQHVTQNPRLMAYITGLIKD